MLRTKNLITNIKEVPSNWVFNRYLDIGEILTGQDVMIKSIFNPKDKRPSLSVYVTRGREYKYHDHSSGNKGSKIDLVMHKLGISFGVAVEKLVDEYNLYLLDETKAPVSEFKQQAKYKVIDFQRRKWNVLDKGYWTKYGIGSKELEYFGVYPMSEYTLSNTRNSLRIEGGMVYGYFTRSGELYKIYQPRALTRRFMKVMHYIQGFDQLEYKSDLLIVTKSLKDVIAIHNLSLGESVSPDSENIVLPVKVMEALKEHYKQILVIFDNDDPGIKAMQKYQELYGLKFIVSPLEKDISDSIKIHGMEKVHSEFKKLITNKLQEEVLQ